MLTYIWGIQVVRVLLPRSRSVIGMKWGSPPAHRVTRVGEQIGQRTSPKALRTVTPLGTDAKTWPVNWRREVVGAAVEPEVEVARDQRSHNEDRSGPRTDATSHSHILPLLYSFSGLPYPEFPCSRSPCKLIVLFPWLTTILDYQRIYEAFLWEPAAYLSPGSDIGRVKTLPQPSDV